MQRGLAHTVRERVDAIETVSLRTDQDLAAFVLRLLHLFENPKHRDDLRAGSGSGWVRRPRLVRSSQRTASTRAR